MGTKRRYGIIDLLFSSFIIRCRLVRVGFLALEYSMVLHSPPVNPSYFSVAKTVSRQLTDLG